VTRELVGEELESGGRAARASRIPWRARLLLGVIRRLAVGSMAVTLPSGERRVFGAGEPAAVIHVHDWRVFEESLASGDIGFAEGYMRGGWSTPSLVTLLEVFTRNREPLERAIYGGVLGGLVSRLKHLLNANTRAGARRNIAAHYDLGNDFYALWLDRSMTYSSALFEGDATRSLEAAQTAKYRRILARLDVRPGDRILEIGCGWGGFAELAAREAGAHVTGISLSREQLRYAEARLAAVGLADRARFEYRDYRDVAGTYDHVVSIEMVEAVGERYWPDYFATLARALRPGGRAMVQAITIADRLFERYRSSTDFIQQYIFPGGMLPAPARFAAEAERAGLRVADRFDFGADYAETLRRWRCAFTGAADAVRAQGFDERFVRMWDFYLAYCEVAFATGCTDVHHYELAA
jgi:cyclopropane-fatty-acyl-phospholipid synthase